MRIFGLSITRATPPATLRPVDDRGGWWPIIREPFTGAWQRNMDERPDNVLSYPPAYSCVTLIASDISKLQCRLVAKDSDGIWTPVDSPAFSPVLRRPNHYQNRIKFFETWVVSKLVWGNTYILKVRDARNVVVGLYVLDPQRVQVLVSPSGDVFYQLQRDDLSLIPEQEDTVAVPAREIIHDVMVPLFHPLVGVSPIYACGLAAVQGMKIQGNSTQFFANGSNPGGILTAPGAISDETATRLKAHWDANYTGVNVGKVAVLGDGLKYERMAVNAVDAQLIEQLKWTAETVAACFHVPAYMVGIGPMPTYNNIQALNQQYYTQCLQALIEAIELLLDEGLELPAPFGTEFDLDGLLRMDTATQYAAIADGIKGGFLAPNEGRAKINLKPVKGGETPYLQQQNFSLAALAERDRNDPFATPTPAPTASAAPEVSADEGTIDTSDDQAEQAAQDRAALNRTRFANQLMRRVQAAA